MRIKKMKSQKIVSLLLVMAYVFTFMTASAMVVLADENTLPTYRLVEKVDDSGNVVVTVYFTGTDVVGSGNYTLEYETSVFELKSAVFGSAKVDSRQINDKVSGKIKGNFYYNDGFQGTTTDICIITLKLLNGSFSKSDIRISSFLFSDVSGMKVLSNHTMTEVQYEIDCLHKTKKTTVIKAATCTEKGQKKWECTVCGATGTETIAATGHHYDDGIVTKLPTYTEKGIKTFTCTNCGKSYTEDIPVLEYPFTYQTSTDGITITGYTGKESIVTIPDSINGKSVTEISDWAFKGSHFEQINLPKTVKKIGKCVFANCDNLKEIKVDTGNSQYCSDNGILFDKSKKTLIRYPEAKISTAYTIPNTVTSIEQYAFNDCIKLKNITIPNSVKNIGVRAFKNCSSLTDIVIPTSITKLESGVFSYCSSLKNITIPESVKTIDSYAFEYCENLTMMTLPNSITTIKSSIFLYCTGLKSMVIPNSVTSMEKYVFYGCSNLNSVTISKKVAIIDEKTFYNCTALREITIPNSVTKIETNAFENCNKLTDVYYQGTAKQWKAITIVSDNIALTKATIHTEDTITLNKTAVTLGVGQSYTLKAVTDIETSLTWKSSNTAVATVSSNGKISAKSSGTAEITVTSINGQSAKCRVTVQSAPTKVSLNKSALIVGMEENFTFITSVGKDEFMGEITYTSKNTGVVTIDKNGNITTKSIGTSIITAQTYNGKTATCRVTVKKAPSSISINRKQSIMGLGETFYLEGSLPADEAARVLTFSSNHPEIATVTDGGIVMAKSKGTAIISITTYNGQRTSCRVTVRNAPTSLTFNQTELTLKLGKTFYLESKFNDGEYARMVTYNSPNKTVATISGSGVIMAKKVGTVKITGKTYNGKTATCTVTVVP